MINRWLALGRLPFPLYQLLAVGLSTFLTPWVFLLSIERRRVLLTNLRLCFPQAHGLKRLWWGLQHMYCYLKTFLDRSWLWGANETTIMDRVHIANPEALDAYLASGKPTILLAPHFLGLDAAWTRLCLKLNMVTMYSNQKNPALNQLMLQGRSKHGHPVLLSRQQGIRPLVSTMRKGYPLYYLPDMDFGERDSVFVSFFGTPAATVTAVGRLSELLQAQVVPVTTQYNQGRYIVHIHPPFQDYPKADPTQSAQFMNHQIETWVQNNIPQYLWLHKRFKSRPHGADKIY